MKKIKNNIFLGIGFATLVYFILILYIDHTKIFSSITEFPTVYLIFAQFIILLSLLLKFIRWNYYLKVLGIELRLRDSFLIFNSGLLMSVTPGKVGELLKSFLIKKKYDYEISHSSSAVLAERIIEFIALVILGIIGIILYNKDLEYVIIAITILVLLLYILLSSKAQTIIYKYAQKIPFLKKNIESIEIFRSSLNKLFEKSHFSKSLSLSIFAWILECLAFYVIIVAFSSNYSVTWSIFIYSFSLFIGSVSMLPGGIGVTEGSLVYLLTNNRFLENEAITITLIIRLITLWVPVIIGFISLMYFLKKIKSGTD